jgi:hypothetical protein
MADRKDYYKLDDLGYVGKQEEKPVASQKYHTNKTSEIFREAQKSSQIKKKLRNKVA